MKPDHKHKYFPQLVDDWLACHFGIGWLARQLVAVVLDYIHMRESDPVDLRFSKYAELRKHGLALIRKDVTEEQLLARWERHKWRPFRFLATSKKIGYALIFIISTFCWLTLLTYSLQFQVSGNPELIQQLWLSNFSISTVADLIMIQPFLLILTLFLMMYWFGRAMPANLTANPAIKSRRALFESLIALVEKRESEDNARRYLEVHHDALLPMKCHAAVLGCVCFSAFVRFISTLF